jgi:DNA-directed RNA polymerase specialized sigma24 family protein
MNRYQRQNDPARIFLSQYRFLVRRWDSLQNAAMDARERATDITVKLKDSPVQGGNAIPDPMAENVCKAIDEESAIAEVQSEIGRRVREILDAIESIPSEAQKTVLTMRYVEGLDWNGIAHRVHYEQRQTFVLHGRGLRHVRRWLEDHENCAVKCS